MMFPGEASGWAPDGEGDALAAVFTPHAVARWRKKPVVLEAMQVQAPPLGNGLDVARWCGGEFLPEVEGAPCCVIVPSLEGEHRAHPGDWVVRGSEGEFWRVEGDKWHLYYEPAGEGP